MKKFTTYLLSLLIGTLLCAQAQVKILDEAVSKSLAEKLDGYMEAIKALPVEDKCAEVDFLVGSSTDSLVRQFIAIHLYSSYLNSKIMGDEAVAIHMTDRWFHPGTIKMQSELDLMNAEIYADFNRQSLIGKKAPELFDDVFSDRPTILFFYSAECPKCLMETILFKSIFEKNEYPVDLAAFYTGQDEKEWASYIQKHLTFDFDTIRVRHYWDPDMQTDFQKKYGLLQTPGIFLVDTDGTIIGRSLDGAALKQLLDNLYHSDPRSYGNEEADLFFSSLLQGLTDKERKDPERLAGELIKIADRIHDSEKGGLRYRSSYKQTMGDFLYYISRIRNEGYRKATDYVIGRYIDGQDIWNTETDTLQIIGFAGFLKDMGSRPAYGSKLPEIKLDYRLTTSRKVRKNVGKDEPGILKHGRLDKISKNAVIIFHTDGCPVCKDQMKAARTLLQTPEGKKMKIIDINMDEFISSSPLTAGSLFESLDLSVMPFIVTTDRKSRITHKYVDLL